MAPPSERAELLLSWYRLEGRSLPWRETSDPWAILVSEVMLQQTRAERVIAHYGVFLEVYPTPAHFAEATVAEAVRAWAGLGYNRRALRLRDAAVQIVRRGWPTSPEDLRALPGVGVYTANAVACFAFGAHLPTPDTNHRRVLGRWHGRAVEGEELACLALAEIPPGDAVSWNQAVMDLGAVVCRPRNPHCGRCPVERLCLGPDVYAPPRPQGRFEGSTRQARGAVLRALVEHGPLDRDGLVSATGLSGALLERAVAGLANDGLVGSETGLVSLVEEVPRRSARPE